jgi:hypothetical protein
MATHSSAVQRVGMWERTHVRRSRGMVSGVALVLLGLWGGIIPFVGPIFSFAYTPDTAWHYTMGRLWLEILPAAATVLGGLILLGSASRVAIQFGAWLAAAAGAWFVLGQLFSRLWTGGAPAAGVPVGPGTVQSVLEQIAYFAGLGVVIVFFAALALGRTSVIGVADLRDPADDDVAGGRGATAGPGTYRGDDRDDVARDGGAGSGERAAGSGAYTEEDDPEDRPGMSRSHRRR